MPPSVARSHVIGLTGSYRAATVAEIDVCLHALAAKLGPSVGPARQRILHDLDALLDRRSSMQREAR